MAFRPPGDPGAHPPASASAGEPPADAGLRAEIREGRQLDRALARELGRHQPSPATVDERYLERLDRRPVLPEETERRLVLAAQAGDPAARAELVEAFMPLIAAAARPYRNLHVQRVELLQEGVVGLLRALEGFDLSRERPFWAYASWWVRPVVLSDRALRSLARLRDAHAEALGESGHEPSHGELAARTGLTAEQVDDLMATERPARSLEEPVAGDDGIVGIFGDLLVDPLAEGEYERVLAALEAEELHALLAGLSARERDVLRARYGLDGAEESLREVGRRLGLSAERVRQIEQRALGKLAAG